MRIIETPEDDEQTEPLRNPRSGFIAYVPPGSIKKGEALVTTGGNGKTESCASATAPICGLARFPASPAAHRATSRARCTTSRWARAMVSGPS